MNPHIKSAPLDYRELQRLYFPQLKPQTIAARACRNQQSLPPSFSIPGINGRFWLPAVVDAWFLKQQPAEALELIADAAPAAATAAPTTPKANKYGRPSNSERAEAQRRGLTVRELRAQQPLQIDAAAARLDCMQTIDMLTAAFHEAGHVVALRDHGCDAYARIYKTQQGWLGHTEFCSVALHGSARVQVALAGVASEVIRDEIECGSQVDEGVIIERVAARIELSDMSSSDLAALTDCRHSDISEVVALLVKRYAEVEATANELIEAAKRGA